MSNSSADHMQYPRKRDPIVVRSLRTGGLIALQHPQKFNPMYHAWVEPAVEVVAPSATVSVEVTTSEAQVQGAPSASAESVEFDELRSRRVWLHGSEEEKARYKELKALLK